MPNAATLLANLLEGWKVPAGGNSGATRLQAAGGDDLWPVHRLAASYLLQIEHDLTAIKAAGNPVDHYREGLPDWYAAVFSYNVPWQGRVPTDIELLDPRDMRLLRALAGQIDALHLSPEISSGQLVQLRVSLEDAQALIEAAEPPTLDRSSRRYLLGLVSRALDYIDAIETVGGSALRAVVLELGGAMDTVAEQTTDENVKKTWREKARGVLVQLSSMAGAAALTTGAEEIVKGVIGG